PGEAPVRGAVLDQRVDLAAPLVDAVGEALGELDLLAVGRAERLDPLPLHQGGPERGQGDGDPDVGEIGLVQREERELAGATARGHQPSNVAKSEAISSADIPASKPLFPALVPARSTACSIVSVVRTPKITGTP